jgi:hypothetical protein
LFGVAFGEDIGFWLTACPWCSRSMNVDREKEGEPEGREGERKREREAKNTMDGLESTFTRPFAHE